jgi:hypothetical protein
MHVVEVIVRAAVGSDEGAGDEDEGVLLLLLLLLYIAVALNMLWLCYECYNRVKSCEEWWRVVTR